MDQRTAATTPARPQHFAAGVCTPPVQSSLSRELRQALHERNLLTAKSRRKVCSMLAAAGDSTSGSSETLNRTATATTATSTTAGHGDADKRLQFRRQAVQEILTTERSYLAQLDLLMKFFVRPLRDRNELMAPEQYQAIFGQIDMIYSLNAELLHELEADLDNVARAFIRIAPFLKLYSVYAFDYNRAQHILQELTDKNTAFRRFLEANESRPEVQRKLISLLIAPIQRVPRYRLLLQQVSLYSSPADADYRGLLDSIREVEATVQHLNAVIRDQETTQALLDLQNSLVGRQPSIVQPSRRVVREGRLLKMSTGGEKLRRHCVLMSDIFMYCKQVRDRPDRQAVPGSLQCCCIFPLKKCRVAEVFPGSFKLTCQGDGIILSAESVAEGREWLAAIRETVDLHVQCRKTIRKGSSKRAPLRRKGLRNFEAQTEEWDGEGDADGGRAAGGTLMRGAKRKIAAKRRAEYDSVFRCADDSDNERNNTTTSAQSCFARINPQQLFKRKRPNEGPANSRQSTAAVRLPNSVTKAMTPRQSSSKKAAAAAATVSPMGTPPIRHWFQPGATGVNSISALSAHTSHMMLTSTPEQKSRVTGFGGEEDDEDFDPTYGMAAYAQHKSLADVNDGVDDRKTANLQLPHQTPKQRQLQFDNVTFLGNSIENDAPQRSAQKPQRTKRVHFGVLETQEYSDSGGNRQRPLPYRFEAPPNQLAAAPRAEPAASQSLRSRIAGFFASLF